MTTLETQIRELYPNAAFTFEPTYDGSVWAKFRAPTGQTYSVFDGYTFGSCGEDDLDRFALDIDVDDDYEGDPAHVAGTLFGLLAPYLS